MTLTYNLDENDFLQHQLFIASKSDRLKKQRRKTWLIFSFSLLLISGMFYQSGNTFLATYFLISSFGVLFFYPSYQKSFYKKHYQKFIVETYKNRFGQTENITFSDNWIETYDITGEAKINLTEIENITETWNYFYLKMKTSGHLIIPKSKIKNVDDLREELKKLSSKLLIDFVSDLSWKFK